MQNVQLCLQRHFFYPNSAVSVQCGELLPLGEELSVRHGQICHSTDLMSWEK